MNPTSKPGSTAEAEFELEPGRGDFVVEGDFEIGKEVVMSPQRLSAVQEDGFQVDDRSPGLQRTVGNGLAVHTGPNWDEGAPAGSLGAVGDPGRGGLDEVPGGQPELLRILSRQRRGGGAGVNDAVQVDEVVTLGLDTNIQRRHVGQQIWEAPARQRIALLAKEDGVCWGNVEEGHFEPGCSELLAQRIERVLDRNDLAAAEGDPLSTVFERLGRQRTDCFGSLGVISGGGAGGYREEVVHTREFSAGGKQSVDHDPQANTNKCSPEGPAQNRHKVFKNRPAPRLIRDHQQRSRRLRGIATRGSCHAQLRSLSLKRVVTPSLSLSRLVTPSLSLSRLVTPASPREPQRASISLLDGQSGFTLVPFSRYSNLLFQPGDRARRSGDDRMAMTEKNVHENAHEW
jgi:hypothetical protein